MKQPRSQVYIASHQGQPFGYMQSYSIDCWHRYAKYARSDRMTMGIDVDIPNFNFLKKHQAFEILKELIAQLGPGVDRVIADPPTENGLRSLFQEYGFQKMGTVLAIDMRHNVRALLMNRNKQLLLMQVEDTMTVDPLRIGNHFWVTIGGGIEKGEAIAEALSREIREETGIEDVTLGELAFYGQQTLLFDQFPIRLFESFYFVYVSEEKIHQKHLTDHEKKIFREIRWWSLQHLLTTKQTVYPRSLAKQLDNVFKSQKIPKEIIL